MKNIFNTLIKMLPLFYIGYILWNLYSYYELSQTEQKQILNTIRDLKNNIDTIAIKNKRAIEFERNLEESKERVKKVQEQIESVQKQLPNNIDDQKIIEFFLTEARNIKMGEVKISPLKEEENEFYFVKPYELKTEGIYYQLLVFFESIANQERLLNISSLNIKQSKEVSKGRFQKLSLTVILEAFRYNQQLNKTFDTTDFKENTKKSTDLAPIPKLSPNDVKKKNESNGSE